MTVSHPEYIEALSQQLAGLLEEEALLLRQGRLRLEALSEALAGNDQTRIERLIEEADRETDSAARRERGPAQTIRRLAEALDCMGEPPSLLKLVGRLPLSCRAAVAQARERVMEQARLLRSQYRQTAALLAECTRLNRALMESLLPAGPAVTTYGAEGSRQWRTGGGLVDAER